MTTARKRQIAVTLDPDLVDSLDRIAADSLASRSLLVEQAIRQFLVRQQLRGNRAQKRSHTSAEGLSA